MPSLIRLSAQQVSHLVNGIEMTRLQFQVNDFTSESVLTGAGVSHQWAR